METEFEWVITELPRDAEGNGTVSASGCAPTEEEARNEMERYAAQYSQDGPIEVELFRVVRYRIARKLMSA